MGGWRFRTFQTIPTGRNLHPPHAFGAGPRLPPQEEGFPSIFGRAGLASLDPAKATGCEGHSAFPAAHPPCMDRTIRSCSKPINSPANSRGRHIPHLPVTALTAAALALLYVILSVRVVMARFKANTSMGVGDGAVVVTGQEADASPLLIASRAHANFAEYVPLSLILLALIEFQGGSRAILMALAIALVIARLAHPLGLGLKSPNLPRALGFGLNQIVLLCAAVYAGLLGLGI